MTTALVNLTPHVLNIHGADGAVINLISAGVARVAETRAERPALTLPTGEVIPVTSPAYGKVMDLPNAREGVVLVVSAMVRAALPDRTDLASPGPLVRDGGGNPVGCYGLSMSLTAARTSTAEKIRNLAAYMTLRGAHDRDDDLIQIGEQLAALAAT